MILIWTQNSFKVYKTRLIWKEMLLSIYKSVHKTHSVGWKGIYHRGIEHIQ